jgi:glycosyltransferase involved in cell wall biosynthesis
MGKHIVIDARIRRASTGRPVARLLEYLQELDTENRYTIMVEPGDPWEPTAQNFSKVACPFPQFSFNPLQQITFARFIARLKPDLVHFTLTGQQPLGYFGRQITMTHDLTMYEYVRAGKLPVWLHKLRMAGYRLLMWSAHRKAKHIIVPTKYVGAGLAKFHKFTAQKITVTLEASEPPIAGDAVKPNIVNLDKFILYVGSAFPHKNLEKLIQSFEILQTSQPELKLILAGKREYHSQQLEKFADKSLARANIIFTGFVDDTVLKWLYQNAQAYVFPSLSEGFGLPPLEAMVHGCPVVASNAACIPEVCGEAAVYFDPNNSQEMAEKINLVLNDPNLRRYLIAKGHTQAAKYSWKRMTTQTLEVYKKALGQ